MRESLLLLDSVVVEGTGTIILPLDKAIAVEHFRNVTLEITCVFKTAAPTLTFYTSAQNAVDNLTGAKSLWQVCGSPTINVPGSSFGTLPSPATTYLLRWLRWKLAGAGVGDYAMITVRAIGDTCC
jgi:hypothetical protein